MYSIIYKFNTCSYKKVDCISKHMLHGYFMNLTVSLKTDLRGCMAFMNESESVISFLHRLLIDYGN